MTGVCNQLSALPQKPEVATSGGAHPPEIKIKCTADDDRRAFVLTRRLPEVALPSDGTSNRSVAQRGPFDNDVISGCAPKLFKPYRMID
jgi:hypothetical protein